LTVTAGDAAGETMRDEQPAQNPAPLTVTIAPAWPVVTPRVVSTEQCGEPVLPARFRWKWWTSVKRLATQYKENAAKRIRRW